MGKTTVGRVLARRFDRGVHLPADRFWEFIQAGYIEPWARESHEQNEVVMGLATEAARRYSTAGYTTILDGIVLPDWFLDPVRGQLGEAGVSVSYVVLRASLETCRQRAGERDFKPLEDTAVVESLWNDFADVGRWESHAIDVEGLAPDKIADVIGERLAAGELLCT